MRLSTLYSVISSYPDYPMDEDRYKMDRFKAHERSVAKEVSNYKRDIYSVYRTGGEKRAKVLINRLRKGLYNTLEFNSEPEYFQILMNSLDSIERDLGLNKYPLGTKHEPRETRSVQLLD